MASLVKALPRITDRQFEVLSFIFEEFCRVRSYPSKSEITRHLKVRTNNSNGVLKPLFKKGLLRDLPVRGEYEMTDMGLDILKARSIKIPRNLISTDNQKLIREIA